MVDNLTNPEVLAETSGAPLSDYPVLDALNKVVELLTQIRDGLGATKDAVIAQDRKLGGMTLTQGGMEDARESSRDVGQDVSKGVSDLLRLPGQSVEIR